jgi:hypothetical protein
MRERGTERQAYARGLVKSRFGASFWDGVEREIEALDFADLALFLRADRLPLEPRPGFEGALAAQLAARFRGRWSN